MENKNNLIAFGLQHNLVIDDGDLSISYQKSNINNNFELIKNINDLFNIFKDNKEDIFKYNTKSCLTLIDITKCDISLHEYTKDIVPMFLKITDDVLNGNDIIICLRDDLYKSLNKICWDEHDVTIMPELYLKSTIDDAENDMSGYINSINLIKYAKNKEINCDGVQYCINKQPSTIGNYFAGYLPSAGQLAFLFKYREMIDYIFNKIDNFDECSKLKIEWEQYWWMTSTECNDKNAWCVTITNDIVQTIPMAKNWYRSIIPFFKQIQTQKK